MHKVTLPFLHISRCAVQLLAFAVAFGLATVFAAEPVGNHLIKLDREQNFHIAAGSLESALIEFSRETAIQVVVSAHVCNIAVAGVEGRRNVRQVLIVLLADSGLMFAIVGQTVTVYAPGATGPGTVGIAPVGSEKRASQQSELIDIEQRRGT